MRKFKQIHFEALEQRRVLASVWQAAGNAHDVDASGLVVPTDALMVINDLEANGRRTLPTSLPAGFQGNLCDVNGDGILSPVDALMIINMLDQVPALVSLDVNLTNDSDLNGDQVVLRSQVTYQVVASPNTVVRIEKLNGNTIVDSSELAVGESGQASLPMTLSDGANHLKFTVKNARGFSKVTERVTRLGDVITQWNSAVLDVVRESTNVLSTGILVKPPPPMVSKQLAMIHGAMFDAINAIQPEYAGYAYVALANNTASIAAAAASAAYTVARSIYTSDHDKSIWDNTLNEVLGTIVDGESKSLGIAIGQQAGEAMIAKRTNDGSNAPSTYQSINQPGHWQPTLPAFLAPVLPQWAGLTPFSLTDGSQFRPAAPPALTSAEYAAAVEEVARLGSSQSTERTADQTEIALFWADGGGTATPPGHWNIIATDVTAGRGLSLIDKARVFALLNYAMADAAIVSWDAKYTFDLWRPIDAIRKAATDDNPATTAQADWSPLIGTPPFPAYTSGHSTFSGAAAAVLTSLLGGSVSFSTWADPGITGAWPPSDDVSALPRRTFSSFEQAALEAGVSRIYGGIHYNFDNSAGLSSGQSVGQWAVQHLLLAK